MNVAEIPKVFWYSVSMAILFVSVGLTLIAYRSAEVSIDFANKTVQLSAAKMDVADVLAEAQQLSETLELENDELRQKHESLQQEIQKLKARISRLAQKPQQEVAKETREIKQDIDRIETSLKRPSKTPPIDDKRFDALRNKLRTANLQIQQTPRS